MWTAIVQFVWGTRVGRLLSLAVALCVLVTGAYLYGWMSKSEATKVTQVTNSLKNIQKRGNIDDKIAKQSPSARRIELGKWVRDE